MISKRILFVDDEPMVLQGLQRMLRPCRGEWEMAFADGAQTALAMMAQAPFDIVVSDMRMPGMNGAEFLAEVMRRHPTTVRLVLSGHADRELIAQCVGVAHQYISKPCDPELLKTTIRNACLLSGELVSEEVKRIIGSINQLPSVPHLYKRLTEALGDENVNTQLLGDIIQQDMGMTAKILKLVNSAFYGLRRTIETPHDAVAYLGIDTIRTLVLANGIFGESPNFATKLFSLDDLWHHTMNVAGGAKAIAVAEHADRPLQDEAFVGGILHDVGLLVLAANYPEVYDRFADPILKDRMPLPAAEEQEFGITHAEVGAYLLGLWGIPAPILKIVGLHHRPHFIGETTFTALLAVHVADYFSGTRDHHALFETVQMDHAHLVDLGFGPRLPVWQGLLSAPMEP